MKMKSIKFLAAATVAMAVLASTFSISAKPVDPTKMNFSADGATGNGKTWVAKEGSDKIELTADITSFLDEDTKNYGGKVTFTVEASALDKEGNSIDDSKVSQKISLNGNGSGGSSKTVTVEKGEKVEAVIQFKLSNGAADGGTWGITLKEVDVECSPNATPTPSETPTPTPTATDNGENTPTPTATATSTPAPTKKPTVTPETTKDPYTGENRVTNAPPTLDPNIEVGEIATMQPTEEPVPTDNGGTGNRVNTDPTFGFIVLFSVLILLLGADIGVIVWRKKMGYGNEINGGVVKRKIGTDLCDYPNGEEPSDGGFNSFDNDLDK